MTTNDREASAREAAENAAYLRWFFHSIFRGESDPGLNRFGPVPSAEEVEAVMKIVVAEIIEDRAAEAARSQPPQ